MTTSPHPEPAPNKRDRWLRLGIVLISVVVLFGPPIGIFTYQNIIPRNIMETAINNMRKASKHDGYLHAGYSCSLHYEPRANSSWKYDCGNGKLGQDEAFGFEAGTYTKLSYQFRERYPSSVAASSTAGCDEFLAPGCWPIELTLGKFNNYWDAAGRTSVDVLLLYTRGDQTLREHVNISRNDYYYDWYSKTQRLHDEETQVEDPAATLTQLGITNESLKQRRDQLLYKTVLPTILGHAVTPDDLSDITIETDQFLS
jgi:hypothetical protein